LIHNNAVRAEGTRGAVYIEFLIAFMPLLVSFLCIWQVSILFTTKLFVDHAAFSGARAAAVIIAEDPNRINDPGGAKSVNVLTSQRATLVQDAVGMALMPLVLNGTVLRFNVMYPDPAKPGGPDIMLNRTYPGMTQTSVSMVRVRVQARMNCQIIFANAILCHNLLGSFVGSKSLSPPYLDVVSEAIFPYQGASYEYKPDDGESNGAEQAAPLTESPIASNSPPSNGGTVGGGGIAPATGTGTGGDFAPADEGQTTDRGLTSGSGPSAPTGRDSSGGIDLSGAGLQHATSRHSVGGSQNVNASTFNSGENLGALAAAAAGQPATQQSNGNFRTTVYAGRMIGTDRTTGAPTDVYTVITTPSGRLVTEFPGQ